MFRCVLAALMCATASGLFFEFVEPVARVSAEGYSVYIPVDKQMLQEKLDFFKGALGGPELYLPEKLEFEDLPEFDDLPEGTHPILVDISFVTFVDFVESEAANNPDPDPLLTKGWEVKVSIPFLAEYPGGPNRFKLGLIVVVDPRRREAPQSDFIHPYIPADQITYEDGVLDVVFGDGGMRIKLESEDECNDEPWSEGSSSAPNYEGGMEFSMFGTTGADRFCSHYEYKNENDFCKNLDDIADGMRENEPNVCAAWNSEYEVFCGTSAEIEELSGFFADLVGYEEGTQPIFVEQYDGDFYIGAKFPCV